MGHQPRVSGAKPPSASALKASATSNIPREINMSNTQSSTQKRSPGEVPSPSQRSSSEVTRLRLRIRKLESQVDEHLQDQARQEESLAEKQIALDRALNKAQVMEKSHKIADKRLVEQEKSLALERASSAETEKQLRQKCEALQLERDQAMGKVQELSKTQHEAQWTDQDEERRHRDQEDRVQKEVSRRQALETTLEASRKSISDLEKKVANLEAAVEAEKQTLREEKEIGDRLRDEADIWEKLLGTRTLEGTIGLGIGLQVGGDTLKYHQQDKDTWTQSKRREKGRSLADELGGFDLQAFAHREDQVDDKSPSKTQDADLVAELQSEIKQLTEANRGLRLYCSKILDRVLSHSDSEQFLVDVSQDPASSRKIPVRSNRQHRPVSRSETLPHFKQDDPPGWDHGRHSSANSTFSPPTTSVDPKTGLRPLSMMRAASTGKMDHVHEVDKTPQDKNERRASRGLSLNWGALTGFGSSTISNTSSPRVECGPPSPAPESSPLFNGRKLEIHEEQEDEQDKIERERLAATMRLMGVGSHSMQQETASPVCHTDPSGLLSPIPHPAPPMQRSSSAWSNLSGRSSDSSLSTTAQPPSRPSVSRWSSLFGRSNSVSPVPTTGTPSSEKDEASGIWTPPLGDMAPLIHKAHTERKREEALAQNEAAHKTFTPMPESVTARMAEKRMMERHARLDSVDSMGSLEDMRTPMGIGGAEDTRERPVAEMTSTLFDISVHES